jgi:hypothetical protein
MASSTKVATAVSSSKSTNKTVEKYFKDLENIKLSETKPITSVDNYHAQFHNNSHVLQFVQNLFSAIPQC